MSHADCVFCNPEKHVVGYRKEGTWHWNGYPIFAAEPLSPVVPGHQIFFPSQHVEDAGTHPLLSGQVFAAASSYARTLDSFNLITSKGKAATQSIMHFHVHVVPRHLNDGLQLPWSLQQEREALRRGLNPS